MRTLTSASVLALAVGCTGTATLAADTSTIIFGDSLSDTGTVFALTGGSMPEPEFYFEGRYSNGPIWVDRLYGPATTYGELILDPTRAVGGAVNFAAAGALSGSNEFDPVALTVAGLRTQVRDFRRFVDAGVIRPAADTTAVLWLAGNDYTNFTALPRTETEIRAFRDVVVGNIGQSLRELSDAGVRAFVLPNAPDVSDLPASAFIDPGYAQRADFATGDHARALATLARTIEREQPGISVTVVDVRGLVKDMVADPTAYGLSAVQGACLSPAGICADPDRAVFWDTTHLASGGHQRVAAFMSATGIALTEGPARLAAASEIAFDLVRNQPATVRTHLNIPGFDVAGFNVSLSAAYGQIDRDARGGSARSDTTVKSASVGISTGLGDDIVVGTVGTVDQADGRIGGNGDVAFDHYAASAFVRLRHGGFVLAAEAGAGWFDMTRFDRPTGFDHFATANAEGEGVGWYAAGEVGYSFQFDRAVLTPFLRLDHAESSLDAFSEDGARLLNLDYAEVERDETVAQLGLEASTCFDAGGAAVCPWGRWAMQKPLRTGSYDVSVRLGEFEDAALTINPDDDVRHRLDGGVAVTLHDQVTGFLSASTMLDDRRGDERSVRAGIRIGF